MTFFGLQYISKYIAMIMLTLALLPSCADNPIKVLLLSGSNNHKWQETTPIIKSTLEGSNKFIVEVTIDPANIDPQSLGQFDVIVSNWNTWPETTGNRWNADLEKAFTEFIANGKGFVVIHAGSSSLQDWDFFQKISGGTWKKGETGHGPVHIFQVELEKCDHPITNGLQDFFIKDELWHKTKLQEEVEILATAFSAKNRGGTGENEPVYLTTRHGKGRGFYSVPGHNKLTMNNNAWKTLLLRGTEWAATGKVSIKPLAPWPDSEDIASKQSE